MCLYFLEKIWFHQKPARLRKPVCIAQSYRKDAFLKICKIKPVSELLAQPSALQLQTALPMCPTHSQGQQPEEGWEITTHWHSYSPMVQENKLSTITSGSLFKTRVFKTWFKPRMWYSSHCWWFNSSSSWISKGNLFHTWPRHCTVGPGAGSRAQGAQVQCVSGAVGEISTRRWPRWPQDGSTAAAAQWHCCLCLMSCDPSGSVHLLGSVTSTVGFALQVHSPTLGEHLVLTPLSSTPTSISLLRKPEWKHDLLRVELPEQTNPGCNKYPPNSFTEAVDLSRYKSNRITQFLSVTWERIIVFWGVIITISLGTFVNTSNSMARSGIN